MPRPISLIPVLLAVGMAGALAAWIFFRSGARDADTDLGSPETNAGPALAEPAHALGSINEGGSTGRSPVIEALSLIHI